MATRVPRYIRDLQGLERRKAVHQWRIGVHRQCLTWGLAVVALALAAGVLIAVPSVLLGIMLGSGATFALMHGQKIGFHQHLLKEIDS